MNFTILLSCRGFCVVHMHWVNLDEAIPLCFGGRSHRKGKMRVRINNADKTVRNAVGEPRWVARQGHVL